MLMSSRLYQVMAWKNFSLLARNHPRRRRRRRPDFNRSKLSSAHAATLPTPNSAITTTIAFPSHATSARAVEGTGLKEDLSGIFRSAAAAGRTKDHLLPHLLPPPLPTPLSLSQEDLKMTT